MIAGGRACPSSTRLTHPTITNQTSPHFAEALPAHAGVIGPAFKAEIDLSRVGGNEECDQQRGAY